MPFTKEQIIAIDDLYQQLGSADQLAEHKKELELLSVEEKKNLAIKLVKQCPEKNMNHLGLAINALKGPVTEGQEETFAHIVSQVWEIRKKISALNDVHHPAPHTLLLAPELNTDLFTEYADYSFELLDGKEMPIAQKLAMTTPREKRSELVRNIQNTFPDSQFVSVVGKTFAFRRELDVLLSDEPYKFFISPEFNARAYVQYDILLELLEDKDEEIAAKLATTPNLKRITVLTNMESIFPSSILLEKTKEVFKTPAKETTHKGSIFTPAPKAQATEEPQKDEAQASATYTS